MDFCIEHSLGYILHLAGTRMRQEIQRQFAACGYPITMPQWHILNRLWEEEGLTQHDLADRTFRDKTTTARTLALLVEQQLIVRERDTVDRRNYQISLTPAGRALKQELIPIATAVINQACTGFSDDQVATLKAMLSQIYTNFGQSQDGWPADESC
ncbi:MAG: MarR family transcriptional regulator [Chloroflexales bacterium]|jgi:MarR family transcriptional regulator, organic hydroperoxide resistance regulator